VLDLFGWEIGMSLASVILLAVGAIVIGVGLQLIGEVRIGYQFVFTTIAAFIGGFLGSEALGSLSTWGPSFEGLYIVPALIGGLVFGVAVDAAARYLTEGSYVHAPSPI
jgi:hypothetical protein